MSVVAWGEHTVAASGKVLATSERASAVLVQPLAANTDASTHFGGGSTVATTNGLPVAKGTTLSLPVTDVSDIWVVGTTAGDKVRWMAIERD